jgi:hypothetical protein
VIALAEKYLEMWKSLGMDIEKHNQLLGILGQYYGGTLPKQRALQSLLKRVA